MIVVTLDIDTDNLPGTPTFKDIPKNHWTYEYVEAAYREGIVQGIAPGIFGMDEKVTREQIATMFVRAFGLSDRNISGKQQYTNIGKLRDKDKISRWARDYVEFVLKSGLMKGTGSETFGADEGAERQQVAVVLDRFIKDKENILELASQVSKAKAVYSSDINRSSDVNRGSSMPNDLLVLVNKKNSLPSNYVPKNLVVPNVPFSFEGYSPKKLMRQEAAGALEKLFKKAERDNIELYAVSGYRSYDYQKEIFNSYVAQKGFEKANQFSAKPGESEHQTGLTMDVTSPAVNFGLIQNFGETKEGKWLKENAPEFGFIIRYSKGKEQITGYQYEPWHLRYVGKAIAKDISNQNTTLEEYLGRV